MLMKIKSEHVSWIHEKCHGNFEVAFDHMTYPNTDHYNLVLPRRDLNNLVVTTKNWFCRKMKKMCVVWSAVRRTQWFVIQVNTFVVDFILRKQKEKKTRQITTRLEDLIHVQSFAPTTTAAAAAALWHSFCCCFCHFLISFYRSMYVISCISACAEVL